MPSWMYAQCVGPSPRARGKPNERRQPHEHAGTIPAGAGETQHQWASLEAHGDHPRGRGGNLDEVDGIFQQRGPSPRARGKPVGVAVCVAVLGTIPAGAGETRGAALT